MNKRGLGKGLDALIPTAVSSAVIGDTESIDEIELKSIIPNKFQPRRVFDEEKLDELVQSIKQYGVLQPVVLRKTMNGYELAAGERRFRASQKAGLKTIPAVVRDYTDSEMTEIALIENLQRHDLNPIEEGMAYRRLMDEFGLTQEEVAKKIGRSRSLIANMVRMLNFQPEVQDFVSRGTLSMGHVRPLLALESPEVQIQAAQTIVEEDLSARDAEELVKRLSKSPRKSQPKATVQPTSFFTTEIEDRLKMLLGTQVRLKPGKFKSKIEIEYYSEDDLERIIEVLSARKMAAATKTPENIVV
jgi:ParB family chromosome partitioning protein